VPQGETKLARIRTRTCWLRIRSISNSPPATARCLAITKPGRAGYPAPCRTSGSLLTSSVESTNPTMPIFMPSRVFAWRGGTAW